MTTFGDSEDSYEEPIISDEGEDAPVDEVIRRSLLEELTSTIQASVKKPNVTYPIDTRNGITMSYRTNIDAQEIQGWRRRSKLKGVKDEIDTSKFATYVIWNTNEHLLMHSRDIGLTVRSPEIKRMTNAIDPISIVRSLFGDDAHMIAHAMKIIAAAGYDEDGQELEDQGPLAT